jgi:hypothetical protein
MCRCSESHLNEDKRRRLFCRKKELTPELARFGIGGQEA